MMYRSMRDELVKIAEDGVTASEAAQAYSRLKKLESSAPTRGELARNAISGAAVMPAVHTASSLVAGTQPLQKALHDFRVGAAGAAPSMGKAFKKGLVSTGRGVLGSALSGAVLGAGLPMLRTHLHREAEKEKLRQYLGTSSGGKLRQKVKRQLGV